MLNGGEETLMSPEENAQRGQKKDLSNYLKFKTILSSNLMKNLGRLL